MRAGRTGEDRHKNRTYLPAAAVSAALLPALGSAQGSCGVASARADDETPEVQIYSRGSDDDSTTYACLRATGKQRRIGYTGGGEGSESTTLLGVYGRWVWLEHGMGRPGRRIA